MRSDIDGVNQTVKDPAPEPEPEPSTVYEATTKNPSKTIKGDDFFDLDKWVVDNGADKKNIALTEGNLVFSNNSGARFELFHVAQNSAGAWAHLGDKSSDSAKAEALAKVYGKAYTYTFEVSATGAFDLQILGAKDFAVPDIGKNNMWISFDADGSLIFNIGSGSASKQSEKEITGNSNFNFGADKKNTVTVTLTRVDGKVLNIELIVNGKKVELSAKSIKHSDVVAVKDGIVVFSALDSIGYGQRVGFYPAEKQTVAVSGMGIGIDGKDYTAQ